MKWAGARTSLGACRRKSSDGDRATDYARDHEQDLSPYDLNQRLLLPPDLREWLPEGHLALFISDVVDELDLSAIFEVYEDEGRGQPPYHPALMVKGAALCLLHWEALVPEDRARHLRGRRRSGPGGRPASGPR